MTAKVYKVTRARIFLIIGAVAALFGLTVRNDSITIQKAHADAPYSQGSYYAQGTYGGGGSASGGDGGGGGGGGGSGGGGSSSGDGDGDDDG